MNEKAELRRQQKAAKAEKLRRDMLIRDLLARQDGREFIWWLLQIGKFGTQPFATDSHLTAFSCGELNVGQQIFATIIETDPGGFLRMQQEINDGRASNASGNTASGDSPGDTASDPDAADDAS